MLSVRRTRTSRALAILVLSSACRTLVDPPLPAATVKFSPPAVYQRWWAMTEACSGLHGSLDAVSWYEVPGATAVRLGTAFVDGYWSAATNRIVLPGSGVLDGGGVRHEMLHALLRNGTHPRRAFLEGCGGVVDCGRPCIADGGPAPRVPSAPTVTPDDIEIGITIDPATPSIAVDSGMFIMTVTAHNPATHAVVVALPPRARGPRDSFSFSLIQSSVGGISGGDLALDSSVTRFAAGETKRQAFDFRVGGAVADGTLVPGTYVVRGAYGHHWATVSATLGR